MTIEKEIEHLAIPLHEPMYCAAEKQEKNDYKLTLMPVFPYVAEMVVLSDHRAIVFTSVDIDARTATAKIFRCKSNAWKWLRYGKEEK